jgi:hypothetical protein
VSDASWHKLSAQISEAEAFLSKHRRELLRLSRSSGLESVVLDFPICLRIGKTIRGTRVAAQFDQFPASLVRAAGALSIALELSIYPC